MKSKLSLASGFVEAKHCQLCMSFILELHSLCGVAWCRTLKVKQLPVCFLLSENHLLHSFSVVHISLGGCLPAQSRSEQFCFYQVCLIFCLMCQSDCCLSVLSYLGEWNEKKTSVAACWLRSCSLCVICLPYVEKICGNVYRFHLLRIQPWKKEVGLTALY